MPIANGPDELLYSLVELRPGDAVPKSKGGPHFAKYNLVPSCKKCNLEKGAEPIFEWWRPQQFWTEQREEVLTAWVYCHSYVSAHTSLQDIEAYAE